MPSSPYVRVLHRNLRQALRQGQLGPAQDLLAHLREEDPLSLETRGLELELLIAEGRGSEAESLAQQLLRLFPASARIHFLSGRIHYQRKQYPRALEHFAEAERLHPHWSVRRWIGKTQTQSGELQAAEAILVALAVQHPEVGRDLAWLYERRGEPARALREIETYLADHADDRFAQAQRLRLRAAMAAPEILVGEIAALRELGEEVAPEMLPAYVQRLLESGQGAAVRDFVDEHAAGWSADLAARIAWVCHRLQAYDVALRLFLAGLPAHHRDFKYCSALEATAIRCGRGGDVATAYKALAAAHPHLHGRLKSLLRRMS